MIHRLPSAKVNELEDRMLRHRRLADILVRDCRNLKDDDPLMQQVVEHVIRHHRTANLIEIELRKERGW